MEALELLPIASMTLLGAVTALRSRLQSIGCRFRLSISFMGRAALSAPFLRITKARDLTITGFLIVSQRFASAGAAAFSAVI